MRQPAEVLHDATQTESGTNENANYLLTEYGVGDFYRAFSISESIDPSRIDARLKNGVLTVHLPKTEKAKPKRITVKAE